MIIALIGLASALWYVRQRQWISAALVVVAACALAAAVGDYALPGSDTNTVTISDDHLPADARQASAFVVVGDGLRAAQWHDLPARPLQWSAPAGDIIDLDFPRQLALGRMFALTVKRSQAAAPWRLQLLAENDQVIADTSGAGAELTVRWLPPVVETMTLRARLLDAAGKTIAQGPVPLAVRASAPLQVQGRFGAPSFDAGTLDQLLTASSAILDWQVTLGKTVTRGETARAPMPSPNLLVVDAAYFEHMNASARSALMAQVGEGMPLLVLAANAADAPLWSRELQLPLKALADDKPAPHQFSADLALPPSPFNPADAVAGPWQATSDKQPWLWQRAWKKGRIVWLGVSDWHRFAITAPQSLASWWQTVLDAAGVRQAEDLAWQFPEPMPMAGERTDICLLGAHANVRLILPESKQELDPQRRADRADARCAAFWPQHAGWLKVETAEARPQTNALYVYAKDDWPQWQRAQRRAATAQYAARTATIAATGRTPLPAWPFALLFAAAILGLWWRERR